MEGSQRPVVMWRRHCPREFRAGFFGPICCKPEFQSRNRLRHFVFENIGVIGIGFGAAGFCEGETFVETNCGFVIACDHQRQRTEVAAAGPVENFVDQQATNSVLAVRRRSPHGDELSARRILFVEQRAGDAAGDSSVHREKADATFAIPAFDALGPLGVVELNFARVSRAERVRSVL